LPCWFTGSLFLCLAPFIWGKVRDPSAGSLLSTCYDGLLIVFQFCSVVWLWMLLTGSGDELCGLLAAVFQAGTYHLLAVSPSAFPAFVYWKVTWRSAPHSSPYLCCTYSTLPLCCMFLVCYSVFFLLRGRESVFPWGYTGLS
jgi:hypothetical protein